jgi:hypothetical protein
MPGSPRLSRSPTVGTAPCFGPTFPNRRFLIAATADGLIDDMFAGMIDYPRTGTIFDPLDRNGVSWVNYHHVGGAKAAVKRVQHRRPRLPELFGGKTSKYPDWKRFCRGGH